MKKNIFKAFAAIAVCGISFASCSNEIEGVEEANDGLVEMTISAASPSGATRTILNDDLSVSWAAGDAISVFAYGAGNNWFGLEKGAGETNGVFSGKTKKTTRHYALYPYQYDASYSATSNFIKASVPTEQRAPYAGSFDPKANIMFACNEDMDAPSFQFESACVYAMVEILQTTIKKIVLTSNKGISGQLKAEFDTDGKLQKVAPTSSGSVKTITFFPPEGNDTFEPGKYYIAMIPTEMTSFKAELYASQSILTKTLSGTSSDPITYFSAFGKVVNLGNSSTVGSHAWQKIDY